MIEQATREQGIYSLNINQFNNLLRLYDIHRVELPNGSDRYAVGLKLYGIPIGSETNLSYQGDTFPEDFPWAKRRGPTTRSPPLVFIIRRPPSLIPGLFDHVTKKRREIN